MSAKLFLRFSTDIRKVPLMDLRCKFGVDCLLPARDILVAIYFYMRYSKNNIPKMAITRGMLGERERPNYSAIGLDSLRST